MLLDAIAQNFVDKPSCHGPALQAKPRFQQRQERDGLLGQPVSTEEEALFAACGDAPGNLIHRTGVHGQRQRGQPPSPLCQHDLLHLSHQSQGATGRDGRQATAPGTHGLQ
jgi:hypothetical protein